jgi:hypothetical protein
MFDGFRPGATGSVEGDVAVSVEYGVSTGRLRQLQADASKTMKALFAA